MGSALKSTFRLSSETSGMTRSVAICLNDASDTAYARASQRRSTRAGIGLLSFSAKQDWQ